ncbi:DeHydrogenases, Short chain [Caenorhabditis elegans]|uniref:DeHydrogenases, Short chain n=1 Tax=Caenorhabditis elegans TaxID=6239 RepID=Q9UAW2_CAEEL|nr:DeHydrogenases, Short chain [Caenorhabditis elegans]CCD68547.1 DeHydrogenases, Short chain [Caenorhabditis elegans]|eukprot:NP_503155.4 Uncharacterized protein CELE_DC2.5 [Caenorhabditis elegans]
MFSIIFSSNQIWSDITGKVDDGKRTRKFHSRTNALEVVRGIDLSGKTYAITGTTSGVGTETARAFILKGAHIVMINRNYAASETLKQSLLCETPDARIDIVQCDLSSLASVKKTAEEYLTKKWPLHGLILNAGVLGRKEKTTADRFEAHFGINHLAHFLLIKELLPVLRSSAPSRIVILSSTLSKFTSINPDSKIEEKLGTLCPKNATEWYYRLYAKSKMCNMLIAFKLHRDEFENGISVYSVHPGSAVRTNLHRDVPFWSIFNFLSIPFTKNASQGAATSLYCAVHPEVQELSGRYWESCWDDELNLDEKVARDEELQEALWEYSEELVGKCLNSC